MFAIAARISSSVPRLHLHLLCLPSSSRILSARLRSSPQFAPTACPSKLLARFATLVASMAIPEKQLAVVVTAFEGPANAVKNTTVISDKPTPRVGPGEVVVRMKVRPLNPADALAVMGLYPGFQPSSFPATPGMEGMGEVAEVGDGVTDFKIGQRVVPLLLHTLSKKGQGSYQQYVKVRAEELVKVPDTVNDEAASQLVVNPATALAMLRQLAVPPGEYVLQTQASGALGRQLIVIAKKLGVRTINIVRRAEVKDELKALGADEVINSSDEDVVAKVKEITGGKLAYGAVDSVAGSLTKSVAASVRSGGTVLIFGGASGADFTASIGDLIFRDVTLKGFWLSKYFKDVGFEVVLSETMALLEEGLIKEDYMAAGERVQLPDFVSALKKQTQAARPGKIFIVG
eukprot:TRINITY_DN670_c0_g1_i5.p1 TRINITY_DN670_c0_g1~~TRINITY_DN670_c0_g1_i5.p1  ORF type:complete len:403 (+),score=115.45 TRINITY_DN670_c0_g1_i5:194-1402(+)